MKILVVNINWLGDAIFSTPVFQMLKAAYPQAQVVCLCPPRVRDVLNYCPSVDKVIVYDERKKHRWPWQKLKLILRLRHERFDIGILIHRSLTRALLVWLAGIPKRVGFSKARFLLTDPVSFPLDGEHRADGYLKVLEGLGISSSNAVCQLKLKDEDVDQVEELLRLKKISPGKYIVFHPAGNWHLKRWSHESWISLGQKISSEFNLPVVLTGANSDKELCVSIAKHIQGSVVLAGQTRLGESLVVFKKAACVISADSGPLHLAASIGADVIGLFGPTVPTVTGVKGLGRSRLIYHEIGCNKAPCYNLECKNNLCMQSITVEDVCREIKNLLDK